MNPNKKNTPMKTLSHLLRPIGVGLSNYFNELNLNKAQSKRKPYFTYKHVPWDDRDENYGRTKGVKSDFIRRFDGSNGLSLAFVFNYIDAEEITINASIKKEVKGGEPEFTISTMYSVESIKPLLKEYMDFLQKPRSAEYVIRKFKEVFLSTTLEDSDEFRSLEKQLLNIVEKSLRKHKVVKANLATWKEKFDSSKAIGIAEGNDLPINAEIAELEEKLADLRKEKNRQRNIIAINVGFTEAKAQVKDLTEREASLKRNIGQSIKEFSDKQPVHIQSALKQVAENY